MPINSAAQPRTEAIPRLTLTVEHKVARQVG
jgi:hypothetical protein